MADGNHIASTRSGNAGPSLNTLLLGAWRNLIELRIDDSLAIFAQFERGMALADASAAPRLREFAEVLKAVLLVLKSHDGAAVHAALGVLQRRHAHTPPSRSARVTECLSPREHSVLRSMSCGLSNKRIAQELQIAPETVKSHVKGIFIKLSVQSRAHAVSTAGALGLL
jgi:ATP/maltotriose-dependent transcriptional regulator MalT